MDEDKYFDVTMDKEFSDENRPASEVAMHALYFFAALLVLFIIISLCCAYYLHIEGKMENRRRERRRREERDRRLAEQTYEEFIGHQNLSPGRSQVQPRNEAGENSSSQVVSGDAETTSVADSQDCANSALPRCSLEERACPDPKKPIELEFISDVPMEGNLKGETRLPSSSTFLDDISDTSDKSSSPSHNCKDFRNNVGLSDMQKIHENLKEGSISQDLMVSKMEKHGQQEELLLSPNFVIDKKEICLLENIRGLSNSVETPKRALMKYIAEIKRRRRDQEMIKYNRWYDLALERKRVEEDDDLKKWILYLKKKCIKEYRISSEHSCRTFEADEKFLEDGVRLRNSENLSHLKMDQYFIDICPLHILEVD